MQLLSARAQAKRLARSSNHTVVQATENNPLKFAHSANEAMRIMLGPATQSYLNPQRAIEQSFEDLKNHQLKTYSAMQHALRMLMADLEPQAIEQDSESVRGIARLLTSRGGRLWEAYRSRWDAKVGRSGNGPVDAFMLYFAEYYERDGGEAP
jgi:type VI secretion system protein ImpI